MIGFNSKSNPVIRFNEEKYFSLNVEKCRQSKDTKAGNSIQKRNLIIW